MRLKVLPIYILIIFIFSCQKKQEFHKAKIHLSELDKLNSKKDIEAYIRKKDTLLKNFELKKIQEFNRDTKDSLVKLIAKRLKLESSYTKVDIDNNGFTDLLVIGKIDREKYDFSTLFFMNFKDGTKIIDLNKNQYYSIAPLIEYESTEPFLIIYQTIAFRPLYKQKNIQKRIKLKYLFDDFIEFNSNPKKYTIEKIEYSISGCFGTCPEFNLTINKDTSATFKAIRFNFSDEVKGDWTKEEGNFKGKINPKEYNKIVDLLNYINFPTLKDFYFIARSDQQRTSLKITFDSGKIKMISDYGLEGTYGLKRLYELISDLRKNQTWK